MTFVVDGYSGRTHEVARLVAAMALEQPASARLGTKEELRRQFKVSGATMSEALRLLQSRGIVSMRTGPGGGVFAAEPSGRLMLSNVLLGFRGGIMAASDVLEAREALEPAIGRLAAERRNKTDLAEIREMLAEMRRHLEDPEDYLRINWRLHRRIAESTSNEILSGLYCSLVRFLEDELTQAMAASSYERHRNDNLALHSRLVDAIERQDSARAARLAAHHAPASILGSVKARSNGDGGRSRGRR